MSSLCRQVAHAQPLSLSFPRRFFHHSFGRHTQAQDKPQTSEVVLPIPTELQPGTVYNATLGRAGYAASYSIFHPDRVEYNDSARRRLKEHRLRGSVLRRTAATHRKEDMKILQTSSLRTNMNLDHVLQACLKSSRREALLQADVVLRENCMRHLIHGEGEFYASYIDRKLLLEAKGGPYQHRYQYRERYLRHYAFRRVSTVLYDGLHDSDVPSSWHAIVSRRLGGLNLLISGEVDCVRDLNMIDPTRPSTYVAVYCSEKAQQMPKKLRELYLRLALMGIPHVYLGQSSEGHLESSKLIELARLLEICRGNTNWDVQKLYDRAFMTFYVLRDYFQSAMDALDLRTRRSPERENRVWHITLAREEGHRVARVRELSGEEMTKLSEGDRATSRMGIIPTGVVSDLESATALSTL